jgi:hypothetical protein
LSARIAIRTPGAEIDGELLAYRKVFGFQGADWSREVGL